MSVKDLSNMRGLYEYLHEIDFENRVKENVQRIYQVKDSDNFDSFVSDFVMLNWVFGIIYDVYEKIQVDLLKVDDDEKEKQISRLKKELKLAEEAIEHAYNTKCHNCFKGVCQYCSNAYVVRYFKDKENLQ